MKKITKRLLEVLSEWKGDFKGAYNIREDGCSVGRKSTKHIKIESKTDKPGLDIYIQPATIGETVSIPACVTHGDEDDLVYNDFYVGENADVIVIAGCGVHTDNGQPARHNGIHRFFLEAGSHVKYVEKHVGTGQGSGIRTINPVTEAKLQKYAVLEMDTAQISGVDNTLRQTKVSLEKGAKLFIRERIFTEKEQTARTEFQVELNGENSRADLVSRAVAKDNSHQDYVSVIMGNAACKGHSECDAIIDGNATVDASPKLCAHNGEASLIHEAAIGKIAGEQILKLRTLGLTELEAENMIIEGFLR